MKLIIYGLIFSGAALMVYNIIGFVRFRRFIINQKTWKASNAMLDIPIILLAMFFAGYIVIGVFGAPDVIMGGILFFGSVFVFIMYRLLSSITSEILENEKLETELLAAEKSNRAKTEFLSNMSHEMRTPMNVIQGVCTLALRNQGLEPATRAQFVKIDQNSRHMLRLIDDILELNRFDTGDADLEIEPFSMKKAIDQVSVMAEALCEDKELSYSMSTGGFGDELYMGDEIQLKNVLLAILNNAAKFTDAPGSVSFDTSAEEIEDGRQFTIKVSDTGVGIDESFIDRVFDMFAREEEGMSGRFGGRGISLALARQTINYMGGDITVESKKNFGSTFTVTFPLKYAKYAADEDDGASSEFPPGCNILIAEDMDENAEILEDLLMLEGVSSERAENGRIAVEMFGDSPIGYYDAILMDLRMPEMDGIEAARRIRALGREDSYFVPIIAITANNFETDRQQTADAGMNAHLAKPVDADLLYDTLKKLINNAS